MSITSIDCPHCLADNVGAHIGTGGRMPDEERELRYYFVAVCRNCSSPVIIVARPTPGSMPSGFPLIREVCRTPYDPVPNVIEPVRMIPSPATTANTPEHVPANVATAFAEAKGCLGRGAVSLAAMGFRYVLERATRALGGDPGRPLVDRLAQIAAERGLHPSFIDWAASVRLAQADMTADEADPSRADVVELVGFVEMFLICAFTLPGRIEHRRNSASEDLIDGLTPAMGRRMISSSSGGTAARGGGA